MQAHRCHPIHRKTSPTWAPNRRKKRTYLLTTQTSSVSFHSHHKNWAYSHRPHTWYGSNAILIILLLHSLRIALEKRFELQMNIEQEKKKNRNIVYTISRRRIYRWQFTRLHCDFFRFFNSLKRFTWSAGYELAMNYYCKYINNKKYNIESIDLCENFTKVLFDARRQFSSQPNTACELRNSEHSLISVAIDIAWLKWVLIT